MRDEVRRSIQRHRLLVADEPVLVALSGGVDSVTLLDVLLKLGHRCEVVHVDHGLRGAESDADRAFVEEHCAARAVPCHVRRVDVQARMRQGVSVQMAARDLRYEELKEVATSTGIASIALAHHRDDAIETFFLELMRGGMGTIPWRTGPFVRPLLGVGREAIVAHANEHGLLWREDASNTDPKYLRNRVRHELLPVLETLSPSVRRVLGRSLDRLRAGNEQVGQAMDALLRDAVDALPLELLNDRDQGALLLHHWLRPLGFHPDRIEQLRDAVDEGHVGATFMAEEHRVTVDREALLLTPVRSGPPGAFEVDRTLRVPDDAPFLIERCGPEAVDTTLGVAVAWLDEAALAFPLKFRIWERGDRMQPIGMEGSKLISDILVDAKVPVPVKERTWVLLSGDRVVWLPGHRVAEGVQAKATSPSVLRIARG